MNYYFYSRNRAERNEAIYKLLKMGYRSPIENYIEKDYLEYGARRLPGVFTTNDGKFYLARSLASARAQVEQPSVKLMVGVKPKPLNRHVPKAAQYSMVYQKKNGEVEVVTISNPIQEGGEIFTAYKFGSGIRSFIKSGVMGINKISNPK